MALITCEDCETSISDQAVACPVCGRPGTRHEGVSKLKKPSFLRFNCPGCGHGSIAPLSVDSHICANCLKKVLLISCAKSESPVPVLAEWQTWTHEGCSQKHVTERPVTPITFACPICQLKQESTEPARRTRCTGCGERVVIVSCMATAKTAAALAKWKVWTHPGCPLQHPVLPDPSPGLVCTYCYRKGTVSTRQVVAKGGINGGKATGAILTAGWSLLATGLATTTRYTEATCAACNKTWSMR